MKRIPLLNVFATLILSGPFYSLLSQSGQGWKADPATVEKLSKSQPDINYYEDRVPRNKLPVMLEMEPTTCFLKTGNGLWISAISF